MLVPASSKPSQRHKRFVIQAKPLGKKKSFPFILLCLSIFVGYLIWQSLIPQLPEPSAFPKIYANPSKNDLRLNFLTAIQNAKKSIFVCVFGMSDPSMLKALAQKSTQGISTTVYYDTKGSPDIRKILHKTDIHPVLIPGIMHQKTLIIDDKLVFLGSANFTTSSLKMHDNLVIGFYSPKIADFLKEKLPHNSGYIRTIVGGQDVELWIFPDPKGNALSDIKRKLKNASRSIKIALFTFTHPSLIQELAAARKRGVEVKVIIDMHSSMGASTQAVETLQKENIEVLISQGVQLMHHKFALIDDRMLLTGSANWTKSAFEKNSDCLIVLHNLDETQKDTMELVWKNLYTTAQKPKSESKVLHNKTKL